jgi:arsenate reductase
VAHWGSEDPAAAEGTDAERFEVFKRVSFEIRRRIERLSELPIEELDRDELRELVNQIGRES